MAEASWKLLARLLDGKSKTTRAYLTLLFGWNDRSRMDKMTREPASDNNPTGTGIRNLLDLPALLIHAFNEHGEHEKAEEVARFFARRAGCVVVPVAESDSVPDSEAVSVINSALRAAVEGTEAVRQGWFDTDTPRCYSPEERDHARAKLTEGIAALVHAKQFVDAHQCVSTSDIVRHFSRKPAR